MAEQWAIGFYTSSEWRKFRKAIILQRGGRCEKCGKGIMDESHMIIHHIKEITPENIMQPNVTLNPDNVLLVCNDCHNIIHHRYKGAGTGKRHIYIVYGAPCSGKTTKAYQMAERGDLIVDYDKIYEAISGREAYDRPANLKKNVFAIRDLLIDNIRTRYGKWNNAYIIGGYPHKVDREELVRKLGAKLIYCESTREECIERAKKSRGIFAKEWEKYIDTWFDEHD